MKKNNTTFSVAALALVAVLLMGMIFAARPPQQEMVAADGEIETATVAPTASYTYPTPIPVNTVFFPTFTPIPPTSTPVAPGTTLIVTKREDTDDGKCDADCSLREAVAVANVSQDTTITFAPGLTGTFEIGDTFTITSKISLVNPTAKSGDVVLGMKAGGIMFEILATGELSLTRLTLAGLNNRRRPSGGIENHGGTLNISQSTIRDIKGIGNGAILNDDSGQTSVRSSLITNNDASLGAAILNNEGTVLIENSTLFQNGTDGGHTIYNFDTMIIQNTTLSKNSPSRTRVMIGMGGSRSSLSFKNSIIAGVSEQVLCYASDATLNDLGGNLQYPEPSCSPTMLLANPHLGTLMDNGGPTLTLSLLPESAAIGIGRDCLPTDQRGAVLQNTAICDAGAYQTNADLSRATK